MQKPPAGRQACSFDSAEMISMKRGICNFLAGSCSLGGMAEAGFAAAISSSAARIATTAILAVAIAASPLCLSACVCSILGASCSWLANKGSAPPMLLIGDGDGGSARPSWSKQNERLILIIAYINHVFNMYMYACNSIQ